MFNLRSTERGNFTVEFAIVGVFFALLIAFSGDVVMKLSIKGKLDRLAYSMVSILKERTELFGEDYALTNDLSSSLFNIAQNSLSRLMSDFSVDKFGMVVNSYDDTGKLYGQAFGGYSCSALPVDDGLLIETTWGRSITLYQVTLCYQSNNWYGGVIGETYELVRTDAVMMGR